MKIIKVISLLQPWASLVVIGAKKFETRSWETFYRGELFIHASKKWTSESKHFARQWANVLKNCQCYFGDIIQSLPIGAIIGSVHLGAIWRTDHLPITLIDERERAFGDYSPGRFAWQLMNPRLLKELIPATGKLGLWNYPWKESDPYPENWEELYD